MSKICRVAKEGNWLCAYWETLGFFKCQSLNSFILAWSLCWWEHGITSVTSSDVHVKLYILKNYSSEIVFHNIHIFFVHALILLRNKIETLKNEKKNGFQKT